MSIIVAISTVTDGNMYSRHDAGDAEVIENRTRFLAANSIAMSQTTRLSVNYERDDFCTYIEIDESAKDNGMKDHSTIIADAIITTRANHALFLPVADCVGASIFDPTHFILVVAHFGRHSLEQHGATKIIHHLVKNYSSDPSQLTIQLTPAAGKDVYKIWALDNKGMKEATFEQLYAAGVIRENIIDNHAETTNDRGYYSYSEFLKGNRKEDGDHAIVAMMTNDQSI
ncbi:laccase domain-containing protein [Candidatus Saccharibacteria bacterium]|nr:laccase domain-containing protein [Candidatus Saccharibacteria bacterium]